MSNIKNITLSLGNTAIFNALCSSVNLPNKEIAELRDIFRRKSIPDLESFLHSTKIKEADKFKSLISLDGNEKVLETANDIFKSIPAIVDAINDLVKLNDFFKNNYYSNYYIYHLYLFLFYFLHLLQNIY